MSQVHCKEILTTLLDKKYVYFTSTGNSAIEQAIILAAKKNSTLLIPDQGGWLSYEPLARKHALKPLRFTTTQGVFEAQELPLKHQTALIINSMPAYAFNLDTQTIARTCHSHNVTLINDATASIGTPHAQHGDIIVGSFGQWKPLPLHKGGFIASNQELELQDEEIDCQTLLELLKTLHTRREKIEQANQELKKVIPEHLIIYKEHTSLNTIAAYQDVEEKEILINIAKKNHTEYTQCPREIRVLCPAISFEVKRHFG